MRMENRTRKCSKHVNLTNFDCRQDVGLTPDVRLTQDVRLTRDISQSRHFKLALIHHYGHWVQQQIDSGWDGYLFTFLFNQLPGSIRAKSQQMEREVVRWYGRLLELLESLDHHNGLRCFPREFLFLTFPFARDPNRIFEMWS
jgi:hypothetical protein